MKAQTRGHECEKDSEQQNSNISKNWAYFLFPSLTTTINTSDQKYLSWNTDTYYIAKSIH